MIDLLLLKALAVIGGGVLIFAVIFVIDQILTGYMEWRLKSKFEETYSTFGKIIGKESKDREYLRECLEDRIRRQGVEIDTLRQEVKTLKDTVEAMFKSLRSKPKL